MLRCEFGLSSKRIAGTRRCYNRIVAAAKNVALPVQGPSLTQEPLDESLNLPQEQVTTGNTVHTQPENRAFYPALDGLRAVAFFMVFLEHYRIQPWGGAGVDVFFVLSGFLITGILWDSRNDAHRVRNFYVRRTLRIFPLYYAVMLAIVLTIPFFHWDLNWKWLVWPLYVGNFARFLHAAGYNSPLQRLGDAQVFSHQTTLFLGHFWSLCVEEQFYLVWPWFVFFIRSRRVLLWICSGSVVVCLTLRCLGMAFLPQGMLDNQALYRLTPFRLDALLLGGLLALVLRGPAKEAVLRGARYAAPAGLFVVLLWMALSPYGKIWHAKDYVYPWWTYAWGLTVIDLLAAVVILVAIQPGTLLYQGLKLGPLRWMGRISYGAYLFHDIPHLTYNFIGYRIEPAHAKRWVMLTALVSTFALAQLSYKFLETPFLNLKARWTLGRSAS